MEFALRSAYAHGTAAIRTHLDCSGPQTAISWGVFREMREAWAGRVALQGVCLTSIEQVGTEEFPAIANETARSGGVLGNVPYCRMCSFSISCPWRSSKYSGGGSVAKP